MKANIFLAWAVLTVFCSCKKEMYNGADSLTSDEFADTSGVLKEASSVPIGMAIDYDFIANTNKDRHIVLREASNVTFGYTMKHGAVVKADGSLDFTRADALLANVNAAGLEVYGHTLVWHQNQNGTYLRSLIPGSNGNVATNLVANGGFETGTGSTFNNWSAYNGATSFTETKVAAEVHSGTRALKVTNTTDNPNGQWRIQMASDEMTLEVNKVYNVSLWVRSASAGGSFRLSTSPNAQYQGDQTTTGSWTEYKWSFTAKDIKTRILMDIGLKANTYFIDDFSVTDASLAVPLPPAEVAAKVDNAMKTFIQGMLTHYAGKVKAWDVVNEPVTDAGTVRTGPFNAATDAADVFYWGQYLGRSYIQKAFAYAAQADPNALLFINDYNLESSPAKLDSLVKIIAELKASGTRIDGVGTQMHSTINTSHAQIDNMFQKLASTGLKVRISELDVRLNPSNKAMDINVSPALLTLQAAMYKYIIQSYFRNVPAAQRYGITIWGQMDKNSWILTTQNQKDAPLLFNNSGHKKPAYSGVVQALKTP